MKLVPSSLGGRLLAGAAVFVTLAIVVAGIVIAGILGHFVRLQLDGRLDAQIEAVASALRVEPARGRLTSLPRGDGPPFDRPGRGWYWQAFSDRGDLIASPSLGTQRLAFPADPPGPFTLDRLRPWPAELDGPGGRRLVARVAERMVDGRPVRIVATAPRSAFAGPLADALLPVMLAMASLGLVLFGALILQVRLGLSPLARLRGEVEMVRTGRATRLSVDRQPMEIAPLAAELNALLERNEAGLERARRHVANLAHGLKTPLATLSVLLDEREPEGVHRPLVAAMERLIRHHLARARAAALGREGRHRTDLVPRLDDLALALAKIHSGRPVTFERGGASELFVVCEAEDCDELFGNLLDNAFRHARTRVEVVLTAEDGDARLIVEDDGPGLPAERMPEALGPGRRIDESEPGFGFGLPIAGEIAELYGGSLSLRGSRLGGLAVAVSLPMARSA